MRVDRDNLVEYALGGLSAADEERVVAHLRTHPEDAAFVRDVFESLAHVAMDQVPVTLPDGSERALLERIKRAHSTDQAAADGSDEAVPEKRAREPIQPAPRRAWWPVLAAAAAVVLVATFVLSRLPDTDARLAAHLRRTCAEPGIECVDLIGDGRQQLGTLARRTATVVLVVMDEGPPDGRVFQGWSISDSGIRSLGVFDGRSLEIDTTLSPNSSFGVTVEPPEGSAQPTSTPITVLQL